MFPNSHIANLVTDPITGKVQEFRHLMQGPNCPTWMTSFANKLGRLEQGIGTRMPTGTNTCFFIPKKQVPTDRTVTYGRIVASIRPRKQKRTARASPLVAIASATLATQAHPPPSSPPPSASSTVPSQPIAGASWLSDFYLNTPLERYEYMRLPLTLIPDKIRQQYQLDDITTHDRWVYIEIRKGMYGLEQAGILANRRLTKNLATYGYYPMSRTPGL
jgi:hypothetical protein